MSNSRSKNALLNIIFALLLQLVTVVSGLILPKIIIPTYGSEINGLVASITQFLSYITLLESGIGGVIVASLYKPLADNDMPKVSGIIKATGDFYSKIGKIFIVYIVFLCAIYPFTVETELGHGYVIALIVISGIGTLLEYFYALKYSSLLNADQKIRVIYAIGIIIKVLNILATLVIANLGGDIVVLKVASCLIALVKPLVFMIYVNRHYKLDKKCKPDTEAVKQRWNGFAHHIAYFIHTSTDMTVITLFLGVTQVSVYSVYYNIVSGIEKLIISISQGCSAGIGNLIAENDKENLDRVVDLYEFVQVSISTVLYTVTALMLMPFITVYTRGITDADYAQPLFGYILLAAEMFYCIRCVYSTIISAAGHFRQTQAGAFIEAALNIAVSLILVKPLGLVGVSIGTFTAMLSRALYEVIYLRNHILHRSLIKFAKLILVNGFIIIASVLLCSLAVNYSLELWSQWVIKAVITMVITSAIALITYSVFYRNCLKQLFRTALRAVKR